MWDDELHYLASLNARTCLLKHDDCNHSYRFRNVGQNLLALSRSKLSSRWDPSEEIDEGRDDLKDSFKSLNAERNKIVELDNNMIRKRDVDNIEDNKTKIKHLNNARIMNKELLYEISAFGADNLNGLWQKSGPLAPMMMVNKSDQADQRKHLDTYDATIMQIDQENNQDKVRFAKKSTNTLIKRETDEVKDQTQDLNFLQQNYIYYRWKNVNISELILDTMILWFDSEYHLMNQNLVNKFEVTEDL